MDSAKLTEGADRDTLNDHEWTWLSNVLYVRDDTGDPDITGVVIEAGQRSPSININNKNYITLDGLHATKANNEWQGNIQDYDNTGSTSRAGLIIRNCEVSYGHWDGIWIKIAQAAGILSGLVIQGNHVHENGNGDNGFGINVMGTSGSSFSDAKICNNTTNDNREEGIRFGDGTALIFSNFSEDDGLKGAAGIIIDPNCVNTKVYRNWVKNPGLEGIWVNGTATTGLEIYYNVMFGGLSWGIQISQGDGAVIYNNVLYDFAGGIGIGIVAQSQNVIIKNNLTDALANNWQNFKSDNSSTYTSDNNIWDEAYEFNPENVWTAWADWQLAGNDAYGYHEDAKMVSPGAEDFSLQAASPGRDSGTYVDLTMDYSGVSVPQETYPAIGAYEYVA